MVCKTRQTNQSNQHIQSERKRLAIKVKDIWFEYKGDDISVGDPHNLYDMIEKLYKLQDSKNPIKKPSLKNKPRVNKK